MDTQTQLQTAEELLKPWALASMRPDECRSDVRITAESLKPAVQALLDARWGYLAAITGLDHPGSAAPKPEEKQWQRLAQPAELGVLEPEGVIEALYHFCNAAAILTLRVSVPYSRPNLPSICDLIPSATLYERELIEMFGVSIEDTPDKERLLLPDDWPEGIYPLRKSFTGFGETQEEGQA